MLGEAWQTVQRLLLWLSVEGDLVAELQPAIRVIQRTLPSTELTVWMPGDLGIDALTSEQAIASTQLSRSKFDAAIILTLPYQSPYVRAYLCYIAGIPIRIGQSYEFGGGVLSHCVQPPLVFESSYDYQLYFLNVLGFPVQSLMVRT